MRRDWDKGHITCPEFDLAMTLDSGQTFHWIPDAGGFSGCIGSIPVHVRQEGNLLHYSGFGSEDLPGLLRDYFAFDHDLASIRRSCAGHPVSREASRACRGLRIMRQPRWECIASFILSPMKQVAHIRLMSASLRALLGKKAAGSPVPVFPTPQAIASSSEEKLRRCGLGFRAKGLLATARTIASGNFDPEALVGMNTMEARGALCTLPGIGRKVANCILLFSYERLDVVPVDVWIARILASFRPPSAKEATTEQLECYGERLLGPYAGYIQQYLFHQARTGKLALPVQEARKQPQGRRRRRLATA